jgi:hypothetical protein
MAGASRITTRIHEYVHRIALKLFRLSVAWPFFLKTEGFAVRFDIPISLIIGNHVHLAQVMYILVPLVKLL